MTGGDRSMRNRAIMLALVAMFVLISLRFAAAQDLWTDEATQLSGSAQPFGQMLRWLIGRGASLGVPGDRMPAISYLVDGLCWRTSCTQPFHFRVLHLAIAAAGVAVLLRITARRYGTVALVVVGLFLAFSSGLVFEAVEIRAYPLFFTATGLQVALFYRLFDAGALSIRTSVVFGLACALAIHVHFFGVVSSCAFLLGIAVGRVRDRRGMAGAIIIAGMIAVAAAGLVPFIVSANTLKDATDASDGLSAAAIARYLLRLTSFGTMLIHLGAAIAFFTGSMMLLGCLAVRTMPRRLVALRAVWPVERALLAALSSGLAVTIAAAAAASGFDPLKTPYSFWTLPVIAVLLGAACTDEPARRWLRWTGYGGAGLLIAGSMVAQWFLLSQPRWFTHGNQGLIAENFGAPVERIAIAYVGSNWSASYFPLLWRYGDRLEQRQIGPDGLSYRIDRGGAVSAAPMSFDPRRFDQVLVIALDNVTFQELRGVSTGRIPPALQGFPAIPAQLTARDWAPKRRVASPGTYWLRLVDLRRRPG